MKFAAFGTIVAASLLAGCSSPGAVAPGSPAGLSAAAGWLSPGVRKGTSEPLLYVAAENANEVLIYPETGYYQSPIGKITSGVSSPYALYVDQSGNLYVANQSPSTVTVYAPGSTTPSVTYSSGLHRPHYMVVDQYGDLFVGNAPQSGCSEASVVEYQPGSQTPAETLHVPGYEADGMDFDPQGNLYVAYRPCRTHVGGIEEFAPGTTQGVSLHVRDYMPQGLLVDNAGNILAVETVKWESVSFIRPGKRNPEFRLKLPRGDIPVELAITADETQLFASSFDGYVYVTNYPLTPSSTWTVEDPAPDTPQGIAISNGQTF
jgi:hypothetical protein